MKSKYDPLSSHWSIIIKSHWRMLCSNTQAVTNGYAAGTVGVQDHLFPKRFKIWIGGKNGKKVYEKKGK